MLFGFDVATIVRKSVSLQRTYNWDVMLPDIGGMSGLAVSLFCQDIKFGDYSISEIEKMRYGAYESKFPGLMTVEDVQMTFIKPLPDVVSAYFYAWRELIVDNPGYYGLKIDYAKNAYVYLYDNTGILTNKIQMVGLFPKNVPGYSLSYGSEDVVKLVIGFNVDRLSIGEYVPSTFQAGVDQAITRNDQTVTIGNSEVVTRQASNARVFSSIPNTLIRPQAIPHAETSPWLAVLGDAVSAFAGAAIKIALKPVKDTVNIISGYSPNPVPKPEDRVPTLTIDVPNVERHGIGINTNAPVLSIDPTSELRLASAVSKVPTSTTSYANLASMGLNNSQILAVKQAAMNQNRSIANQFLGNYGSLQNSTKNTAPLFNPQAIMMVAQRTMAT